MTKAKIVILIFLLCLLQHKSVTCRASLRPALSELHFVNKALDLDHIDVFFQDVYGRIWADTYDNDLLLWNGETFVKNPSQIENRVVHCQYASGDRFILIGAKKGVFLLDTSSGETRLIDGTQSSEAVNIVNDGQDPSGVLLFEADGVSRLDLTDYSVSRLIDWEGPRIVDAVTVSPGKCVFLVHGRGL